MTLQLHHMYTREKIHEEVGGGDLQSYLPHVDGSVLCGCFDPRINARAPFEIDIGSGPDVIHYAKRLVEQRTFIPVFLKHENTLWRYVGRFRAFDFNESRFDLFPINEFRRRDAIAVLYLEDEMLVGDIGKSAQGPIDDLSAPEGGTSLVAHIHRERNHRLLEAKRRLHRAEFQHLICQACGLSETQLPPNIGEGCYEVHHLEAIGARVSASLTKLNELAVLCANCHRMIHRSKPMLSPKALAQLLSGVA